MSTLFAARTICLCLAAIVALATKPSGQQPEQIADCSDARFAPALQTIRDAMREQNTPSVAIAVAERGRVVCEAAFGWADVKGRIAATPSTMYSLASISKPFTATALMRLVEEKKIDLRRPANAYLGEGRLRAFEGKVEDATVERLLTHTAGLPLHYQFFYAGGPAVPAMDDAISRYGIVVYPPGERFVYSNFGFGVLERILEIRGGGSYAAVLGRTVLDPLGLTQTMVSDGAGLDGDRAAVRYDNDQTALPAYTFDHVGASGVWSSARDLIRFGMFHLGHEPAGSKAPLSRATRQAMQRAVAPADAPGRARGLGWGIVERVDGRRQVSHTGSMPGVSTILALYPEDDVAVVVLTNISNPPVTARMERALREAVLKPIGDRATSTPQPPAGGAPSADTQSAGAIRGNWSGAITLPSKETLPVSLSAGDDNVVRVRIGSAEEVEVSGARLSNGWLTGRLATPLAGPDAAPADRRMENRTTLTVALRGDRLAGWVSSMSSATPTFGAVSFPIHLVRVRAGG